MPTRVFITGALGFIGQRLARRYREAGSEVAGVDLRSDRALGVVAGDLTVAGAWQEAAAGADRLRPWRRSGTRRMLRLIRGRLWISETAGIVFYLRAGRLGERRAADATRWMLALPTRSRRITRVYAYQWQAPCRPDTWDSAWFRSNGSSRPSYRILVAALARERRLGPDATAALDPPLWPGVRDTCGLSGPSRTLR